MSLLPEPSLKNLELGLRNVNINNGKFDDSRISKGYLSNNKVSLHNGKGMHKKEDVEEEEEEEEDDDIEADILRQSGYSTIKKPSIQPMPIEDVEDEEEEEDDDIEADILRQSGYSTIKKLSNQPMPIEDVEEEEEEEDEDIEADILRQSGYSTIKKQQLPTMDDEEEDEEEDDITTDILKQSGYGSMKKPTHRSTPKTPAPIKLISAIRGSREKEGAPTRIMSVTWSPEVYDPIPSAETFVRIKKPRLKSDSKKIQELKKNGKPIGKDKGKASKAGKGGGSNSKDKKSKHNHNSKRSYGSFDNDD